MKFESTSTIQGRALAEFIAERTPTPDEEVTETFIPNKESPQEWICVGAGMLLVGPSGEHLKYIVQMHFAWAEATNNTA